MNDERIAEAKLLVERVLVRLDSVNDNPGRDCSSVQFLPTERRLLGEALDLLGGGMTYPTTTIRQLLLVASADGRISDPPTGVATIIVALPHEEIVVSSEISYEGLREDGVLPSLADSVRKAVLYERDEIVRRRYRLLR